ncbi:MAG TPA: FecR domain-containing protein [Steroidobacteraceae bacterium]|nr:FecR domain-containing protein [Steroidobacteraceae bacterium]
MTDKELVDAGTDDRLGQAVEWFQRMRGETARVEDLPELQRWMQSDPQNALAYQRVSATWSTVGAHASAPEIVIARRDALEHSRKAGRRRWSAKPLGRLKAWAIAASALLAVGVGLWSFVAQRSNVYTTDLGERRTLTLPDGSVVTLDARSRMRVKYTDKERLVALEQGQARFTVAKDPLRPFRVRARNQTVVALGTQFDVELVFSAVLVTLIEGHVAVTGVDPLSLSANATKGRNETLPLRQGEAGSRHREGEKDPSHPQGDFGGTPDEALSTRGPGEGVVELTAGEGLRIRQDGRAVLVANVDLDRATAWQSGKMFFDNEPLASAAERVNRYARRQIAVDPSVATVGISGVFNAGDPDAFVEAVTLYFPVQIDRTNESEIRLTARK